MTQSASAYARVEGDKYFTPAWPVAELLRVEKFAGPTLDPGAGAGHVVDALRSYGIDAYGIDISPDREDTQKVDFFTLKVGDAINIVANPPYGKGGRLAVQFIEHALKVTEPNGGKVAMLLRADFDSANGRRPIFGDHPAFAAKYVLTKRIRWANLEQSAAGPTENHQWLVWDWRKRSGAPVTVGYLPLAHEVA